MIPLKECFQRKCQSQIDLRSNYITYLECMERTHEHDMKLKELRIGQTLAKREYAELYGKKK